MQVWLWRLNLIYGGGFLFLWEIRKMVDIMWRHSLDTGCISIKTDSGRFRKVLRHFRTIQNNNKFCYHILATIWQLYGRDPSFFTRECVVWITHEHKSKGTTNEQTIICGQLFADHVVGWLMKKGESPSRVIILSGCVSQGLRTTYFTNVIGWARYCRSLDHFTIYMRREKAADKIQYCLVCFCLKQTTELCNRCRKRNRRLRKRHITLMWSSSEFSPHCWRSHTVFKGSVNSKPVYLPPRGIFARLM